MYGITIGSKQLHIKDIDLMTKKLAIVTGYQRRVTSAPTILPTTQRQIKKK